MYQNKLLHLVGEVARSDGGVSRPQRQIRRSVTAGKHETVSHYISIAPNYSFLFALRLSVAATTHIPAS